MGCNKRGIRQSEFVTKTQFLCCKKNVQGLYTLGTLDGQVRVNENAVYYTGTGSDREKIGP